MQPLREAIKSKYGVSDEVSNQVIKALAEVERQRQTTAGSEVQGFRARQPGDPTRSKEVPDIGTIIGEVTRGGQSTRSGSAGQSSSGLIGMIISIIMSLLSVFLGSRQNASGSGSSAGAVTNILTDLLGGASTPGQAPDLGSIIGGLLQNSGGSAQSGNQSFDVSDIMNQVLGTQGSADKPSFSRPRAK